jgi:hypothetical protein
MSKEAMQLALEALETERPYLGPMPTKTSKAIAALQAALAEQPAQQEPEYAWPTVADYENDVGLEVNQAFKMGWGMARTTNSFLNQLAGVTPQPAQRTWVGLTDEEIESIFNNWPTYHLDHEEFARAIEAKLKERNQ